MVHSLRRIHFRQARLLSCGLDCCAAGEAVSLRVPAMPPMASRICRVNACAADFRRARAPGMVLAAGLVLLVACPGTRVDASCGDYVSLRGAPHAAVSTAMLPDDSRIRPLRWAVHFTRQVAPVSATADGEPASPALPDCHGKNCHGRAPLEPIFPLVRDVVAAHWACIPRRMVPDASAVGTVSTASSETALLGHWRPIDRPPRA